MESVDFYLGCAGFMLVAQFSPGPDMLLLMRTALHERLTAGLWTVLGIALGLLVHCLAIQLGLEAVFRAYPLALRVLAAAGACYLLWIAWQLAKSVLQPPVADIKPPQPLHAGAAFSRGLLTNLTNAKAFLFLASFLAMACQNNTSTANRTLLVTIIVGQALLGWAAFVWLLQKPAAVLLYQRAERPINLLFAILLVLAAISALWWAR